MTLKLLTAGAGAMLSHGSKYQVPSKLAGWFCKEKLIIYRAII